MIDTVMENYAQLNVEHTLLIIQAYPLRVDFSPRDYTLVIIIAPMHGASINLVNVIV